jgi:type II secretory pathway pseudopilin PulG
MTRFTAAPRLVTHSRKRKQQKAEAQDAMVANDTREYIITTDGAVATPPTGQVSHYRTADGWRQKDSTGTASDVGGGAADLAAVLTEGNDTGGTAIVHAAGDDDALAALDATTTEQIALGRLSGTATGDGEAHIEVTADAQGEGDAELTVLAQVGSEGTATALLKADAPSGGDANARAIANAPDGVADASRTATAANWRARANTTVGASNGDFAEAYTDVSAGAAGNARTRLNARVTGTGTASAEVRAYKDGDDVTGVGLRVEATAAGGYKAFLDGLPTADPAEAGRLWNDSGALMISAG